MFGGVRAQRIDHSTLVDPHRFGSVEVFAKGPEDVEDSLGFFLRLK